MSASLSTFKEVFPSLPSDLQAQTRSCPLDFEHIPKHIAIIMDGNGRWALERGLNRSEGHKAGVGAVREAIVTCNDIGVSYLTIYSFSTENWKRPLSETSALMKLFADTMLKEIDDLMEKEVKVVLLGQISGLPKNTHDVFIRAQSRSAANTGLTLAIAVNYGARAEIADAARILAKRVAKGELDAKDITEELFEKQLYTAGLPDPDLCIRTAGERRLSNFLLWQLAYAEFYVSDVYWPDFDRYELLRALLSYQKRSRRFGKVS